MSEVTLLTNGVVEATLEGSPLKDLMVTLDCARPEPSKTGLLSSAKCTLDYKKEAFTAKAAYDLTGLLACSGTYAYDALTFGINADYMASKGVLKQYGAACQFVQPEFSVIAKLYVSPPFSAKRSHLVRRYHLKLAAAAIHLLASLRRTPACTITRCRQTCKLEPNSSTQLEMWH